MPRRSRKPQAIAKGGPSDWCLSHRADAEDGGRGSIYPADGTFGCCALLSPTAASAIQFLSAAERVLSPVPCDVLSPNEPGRCCCAVSLGWPARTNSRYDETLAIVQRRLSTTRPHIWHQFLCNVPNRRSRFRSEYRSPKRKSGPCSLRVIAHDSLRS